jgi:hypothetical protein
MTPTELTDAARNVTNTNGSTFVSDAELLSYLNFGLRELSTYARCYETTDSYSSVVSQMTYTITGSAFEIKYLTYDGTKVHPVTQREAEAAGFLLQDSSSLGRPTEYYRWGNDVVFHPAPATAGLVIKVYSYGIHPTVTASATISMPEALQHYLVDYLCYRIASKEIGNPQAAQYLALWNADKESARKEMIQRNRSDSFRMVQSDENLVYGPFGIT